MFVGICKLEDFSVGFRECHLICLVSQWHLIIHLWAAEAELNKKPQYHTVTERYPSLGYKTREEEEREPSSFAYGGKSFRGMDGLLGLLKTSLSLAQSISWSENRYCGGGLRKLNFRYPSLPHEEGCMQ